MMVSHRRSGDRGGGQIDAPYVHYSPPKLVDARRWARGGEIERLREAALGGHAHRLLGLAAPGARARNFLKDLPTLIAKCDTLHAAVSEGNLSQLQDVLETDPMRKRLALCRDRAGVGLLHKAVFYDFSDIIRYLLNNYPQTVYMRDSEGRTPLHYAALCKDPSAVSEQLLRAGAERSPQDSLQKTPAYYLSRATILRLPEPPPPTPQQSELVIKPANIRIWCHDRDLGRLQQVVWKGQGARLRTEVSSQPAVRKFLEAVPHIMGTIKDIHTAVIQNDIDKLKSITNDPVPSIIFSSIDPNGLTALHKAAGLGRHEITSYILSRYPEGCHQVDNDGRTPLHWSILAKDDDELYDLLHGNGADEAKLDNKLKSAAFYKNRPTDLDKSLLGVTPDAPRVASATYPSSWDWELLKTDAQTVPVPTRPKKLPIPIAPIEVPEPEVTPEYPESVSEKGSPEPLSPEPEPPSPSPELETHTEDISHIDQDDGDIELIESVHPETEIEHIESETTYDDQENFEGESNEQLDENVKTPDTDTDLTNEPIIPNVDEPSDPKPLSAHSAHIRSTKTPGTAPVNKRTRSITPDSTANDIRRMSKTASPHKNDRYNNTPDSVIDSNTQSPVKDYDNEDSDFDEDEAGENDNQTPTGIESADSHLKPPQVQDIDDDKGDEPDLERNEDTPDALDHKSANQNDEDHSRENVDTPSEYGDVHKADTADVLDVEHLKQIDNAKGRNSQASESTIEGVVNGDPEVDSLDADRRENEDSHDEIDANIEDSEIQMLVDSGNMEQLAALVLNGEGERLVGHMARNPELQAFLDNVPSYMNKIKRVHLSARDGGLRELQAALDRRKFAVARDQVSPGGATPLHVAVLFGHTPVLRYLAGRFPETLSAVDFEGRTALHYAAVLKDNGHYYNILLNMGANPKDQDDNGRTPEDYLQNDKYLTHKQLLKDFGAEESLADEMLNDKDAAVGNGQNGQVDIPIFRTEEGKYLASSLGDPLIKGLTEVANTRPKDPIAFLATYLYNFANQNQSKLKSQESIEGMEQEMPLVSNMSSNALMSVPVQVQDSGANQTLGPSLVVTNHKALPPTPPPPVTPGGPEAAFSSENRDEHGQSMLHFAAARGHARGALLQLVREAGVSPAFRDELYRTARDVSIQANMPENTIELDRWLLETAARGEVELMKELLMEGYDHILDVMDDDDVTITDIVERRGLKDMSDILALIPEFEESRERLHQAIRQGDEEAVRTMLGKPPPPDMLAGRALATAKNSFGRCSLHVAVLAQREEIAEYIARAYPDTLRIGDNLERTALHYAMGVDNVESTSRILIKAGAKRVLKDLKGRQPSYYFMNKSEILRLKEEEEAY